MAIKTMLVKIGADVSDLTAKFNQIGKQVDDNKRKIQSSLNKVSLAVGGVGIAAIKMATDFNTSMSNIATLIPEKGVKRVNELKGSIQDLAIDTGKATGDIADGAYQVISAFGDTADTVKILETNVRAAAAGMASTTDAINLTSAVTKGYGDVTAEAIKKASDLAFTTVKLGQTTFPELANSIGGVVPVAKKLNVSQEELFGTFATFTGVTGDASKVATQFEGVLGALIKPTEEMELTMNRLGYASGEAMIKELGLQGTLEALIGTTDGSSISIGKLITRKEGLTLAMAMTGAQSDVLKDKIGAMKESAGAAETAFDTMTTGVGEAGFKFAQAKQQIAVLMQTLGDKLAPVVANLAERMKPLILFLVKLIEGFSKLPKPIQTVILALGGLAAGAAPMFKVFTGIKGMIPTLVKGFGLIKGAFLILLNPIGLVIAALAAVTIGFLKVKEAQKQAEEASRRYAEVNENLFKKLETAALKAGMTKEEFAKLRKEYDDNSAALAMAIKRGKEGKEMQEALAETGKEHAAAIQEQKDKMQDADPAARALAEAIQNIGTESTNARPPLRDLKEEAKEFSIILRSDLSEELKKAEGLLKDLKSSGEATPGSIASLAEKVKELKIELGLMDEIVETKILPTMTRDFMPVIDKAPGSFRAFGDETEVATSKLSDFAYGMTDLEKTVKQKMFNMQARFMGFAGITLPKFEIKNKEVAEKCKDNWTDVSQRIKDSWTTNLKDMILGSKNLGDALKGIWGTVKEQFATLVAQMISKWTLGFIGKIVSGSGGLLSSVKGIFGGIGKELTGAATGGGAGGVFGGLGKSFLGTIGKMAGPLGIGLLVGKIIGFKNITKTVQDVWKAVSDNVVGMIKGIGKVSDAIFGAVSDIVGGIGKGIGGLLSGIGGILGGKKGGIDSTDKWHWKATYERVHNMRDLLRIDFTDMMHELINHAIAIREFTGQRIPEKLHAVIGRIDTVKSHLKDIRGHAKVCAEALKNIPKAQHGGHFDRPTLAVVGEVPETVIPDKKLADLQRQAHVNMQAVFNIKAMDPRSMREVVRSQIAPEFIEFVRVGLGKTKLKEALL